MRMHTALNVKNLEVSLGFYEKLFNVPPTKVKPNYAKFELDQPPLHFSLNVRPYERSGVLNHLGFQVGSREEVLRARQRLQDAGLFAVDEMDTTCCYAVQDKIWVTDPEGTAWEVFYTREDSEFESAEEQAAASPCCTPLPEQQADSAGPGGTAAAACCVESLPEPPAAPAEQAAGGGCGCRK